MGNISIYSLPNLRRQILINCLKPTDITALSSFLFTPYAHAFYLQSSSELSEISFSPQSLLSYSMMISYDKFQRKTIIRSVQPTSMERNTSIKDSISSSPPKSIEPEEPVVVKSDQNGNNSNSDSAIDLNSINITNNQPSQ
jgi:hypothetical protein